MNLQPVLDAEFLDAHAILRQLAHLLAGEQATAYDGAEALLWLRQANEQLVNLVDGIQERALGGETSGSTLSLTRG